MAPKLVVWVRSAEIYDREAHSGSLRTWSVSTAERLQAAGGELLCAIGASVTAAFDPENARAALALLRDLVTVGANITAPSESMEPDPIPTLRFAGGAALGPVHQAGDRPRYSGAVIDRAQRLAHQAKPGGFTAELAVKEWLEKSLTEGETAGTRPSHPSVPPPVPSDARNAGQKAKEAVLARDFDKVHQELDRAEAAGTGVGSQNRLRALAYLGEGDPQAALASLAGESNRDAATDVRDLLMHALILIETEKAEDAVRVAVLALANARAQEEHRAEQAALKILTMCYRALGRHDDAARIIANRS